MVDLFWLASNLLFLKEKIKKFFLSIIYTLIKNNHKSKVNNLIISKSGNTLETISNVNIYVKNNDKNIIITQNKTKLSYGSLQLN